MEIREEKERKRVCEEEAQKVEAAKHFENDLVEESSSDETVEMPPPPTRTHKRNIKTGTDLKNWVFNKKMSGIQNTPEAYEWLGG